MANESMGRIDAEHEVARLRQIEEAHAQLDLLDMPPSTDILVRRNQSFWQIMHTIGGCYTAFWLDQQLGIALQKNLDMGSGHYSAHQIIGAYREEFDKPDNDKKLKDLIDRMLESSRFCDAFRAWKKSQLEKVNHYTWLQECGNWMKFLTALGLQDRYGNGMIGAHGDKCWSYREQWTDAGVPWFHGAALYLLSYCRPYSEEVRDGSLVTITNNGRPWKAVDEWVVENYERFKDKLPPINEATSV